MGYDWDQARALAFALTYQLTMARQAAGPRTLDSSGLYYAVKVVDGKRHSISLGTKSKSVAWQRWPAAQAQLEAMAAPTPGLVGTQHLVWDPETDQAKWEPSPWDPPEEPEGISWEQAIEVAARRTRRRSGREPSRSWHEAARAAIRLAPVPPEQLRPNHIREMIARMEEAGLKDSSISQRCSILSGLITALIRTGVLPDHTNPFSQVDYSSPSVDTHPTAAPAQYRELTELLPSLPEGAQLVLRLVMLTGARISECCNAKLEPGWMRCYPVGAWRPKNRASERSVPLPLDLDISAQRPSDGAIRKLLERRGFTARPHAYRHGWKSASRLAQIDELVGERLLGHTPGSRISFRYGQFPEELLREQAERVWQVINGWCG